MELQLQIGDLVKYLSRHGKYLHGLVINFDLDGEAVLCFMEGKNMWFRSNQVERVNASR